MIIGIIIGNIYRALCSYTTLETVYCISFSSCYSVNGKGEENEAHPGEVIHWRPHSSDVEELYLDVGILAGVSAVNHISSLFARQ